MTGTSPPHEFFAVCAPGTEPACIEELRTLGLRTDFVRGGVAFRGTLLDAARANLWLRTASRVLLRLGAFDAPGRRELAARARRLDFAAFVAPGSAIKLHVSAQRSRLYHTGLIAEVFHEATGFVSAPKDSVAPEIFLRFDRDRCTVSIDTSGALLHRRGYRQDVSQAPLRETLAAAMLLLCRYDGSEPLVDPMCGSGTIPIEAHLIATRRPPGLDRSFALEAFPAFQPALLQTLRDEARSQLRPPPSPLFGSDIHAGALAAARENAARAHAPEIEWERIDVARRQAPRTHGLLVTNPPYGKRVGGKADRPAASSLDALSNALEGAFRTWRAGILVPAGARPEAAARVTRLDNGGIPVDLVEFDGSPA